MSELPKGWEWTTIDEIAATSLGKMLDKKQATGLHPTPYLRNINVRWGGFDLGDLASMDIRPDELDRVLARAGDLIVCEGGEPGRAAVWRGERSVALQKALHRVRPYEGVSPDYLAFLLWHLADAGQLANLFTGSTIKHLPQEKLRVVPVPLPPSSEQVRIVAEVDAHLTQLDSAERQLKAVARRLGYELAARGDGNLLRRSLFAYAFAGRLVPQDPEDEPASVLLDRVRAVRAGAITAKRARRTKAS